MGFLNRPANATLCAGGGIPRRPADRLSRAYTTFSTLRWNHSICLKKATRSRPSLKFLSVVLCMVAVWIGMVVGRKLFADDAYLWLEELPGCN